jgi:hypothetical protein
VRSLESRVRANLRCHFGGLAITITDLKTAAKSSPASQTNPKAPGYDVEAARKASYGVMAELAYNRYGTGRANQSGTQQPPLTTGETADLFLKARQKVFDTLKASPEIAEVSDLYQDNRYKDSIAFGAFAPIFFVYRPITKAQPPQEAEKKAAAKRFYFVYNGRFLIAAAFSEPGMGIPALSETVSEVCLLMSKSGYDFRWLSPIPTLQSVDLGGTSIASSPMASVLNDSVGRMGTTTTVFTERPRGVQDSLRSLYAVSFQYMMAFYSLKEESDTRDALVQTIGAHRGTVLDLMHEFNQTKGRQFLRRRKLRSLIRAHCFNLTEKVGRVDAISESLGEGITSLEANLQQDPDFRFILGNEPNWRSYLHRDFDTKPVLDMITRTDQEISRPDMGFVVFLVALLAAAVGAIVGSFIGRIV